MDRATIKRILVRGPNWLGDAVMCEPALRGLKRLFPNADLTLLVKPAVAELFIGYPSLTRVLIYNDQGPHAGLTGKWTLAGQLRRYGFDCAVLFQNAFEAALLAFLAGVPRRYGYATDGRSLLLTEPVAVPDRRTHLHQVHYYWDMLKPLGLGGVPSSPELSVTTDEEAAIGARLARMGITSADLVVGLNPGSTYGSAKRWLPERFAEAATGICRRLEQARGRRVGVLILGAQGEEPLGGEIAARLTLPTAVLSGATTIRELMAATKRCSLLVTNDTGPMHIATALGVPVVAIFGPTDWRTTSPYGARHAIVRQPVDCAPCMLRECPIDHRCMTGVSVEMVYEAGLSCLSGQSGPSSLETDQIDQRDKMNQTDLLKGITVFLDRDGTLNEDLGYIKSAAELRLLPGVAASLARLKAAGAKLVVVTNQSGIGRGLLTHKDLEAVHARLQGILEGEEAALDAIYFCPHHPDDGCRCRKPGTAMVERAASELQLDLRRAYVIGDRAHDIELGNIVGAKTILLPCTSDDERMRDAPRVERSRPHMIARSIAEAAEWILKDASHCSGR